MENTSYMGEEKIGKLIMSFSVPAIIGMLVNALYNVVDRIFVGQGIGTLAISGLSVTYPIIMIIFSFQLMIGIGAASLVSIKLGEKKYEDIEKILSNSVFIIFILTAVLSILIYIFIDPLLMLFGAGKDNFSYAKEYMTVILYGSIFWGGGFIFNQIIRALGHPAVSMFIMLAGAIINIILDALFIFTFKMGIFGAAFATIIAEFFPFIFAIFYFTRKSSVVKLKLLKPDKDIIRQMIFIGMGPFSFQAMECIITVLINRNLAHYGGAVAIAVFGIINTLLMLFMLPVIGLNQGVQPIIGYNYGSGRYDRVKEAYKLSVIIASCITILGGIIMFALPDLLFAMFNANDKTLISMGTEAARYSVVLFPIVGFLIVNPNFFQSIGKGGYSLFLSLLRQFIVLVPLTFILPGLFGLKGIWYAFPITDLICFIVSFIIISSEMKKLNTKNDLELLAEEE